MFRNRAALVGGALVLATVLAAVFAPVLTNADPLHPNVRDGLQPPGPTHVFGTDELGRDLLSRVLYGARVSLAISAAAVTIAAVLGTTVGLATGYVEGWVDFVVMRVIDTLLAFPGILLAMVVVTILGSGSESLVVAIAIATLPAYVRVTRASAMSLRRQEFVEAARAIGCTPLRIVARHILPNAMSPVIVLSTLGLATAILSAASLSYLGLGAQPPTPELGAILAGGKTYIRTAWWLTAIPGLSILLVALGVNMLGDGLRDALDPRIRL
jgi:peptide/nickel transport system permease protein